MKRIALILIAFLSLPFFSYSGGIVHNTNQSVAWVRMYARDASTGIDAVFFNPAGLTKLDDGFYISLNEQVITQTKYITNNYTYLNGTPKTYEGDVFAPIFPGLYAAYKTGKFVVSLGINPIGGGGSATFNNGLPSFEIGISDLVPAVSSITAYSMDAYFEGSSVFWGYQLGVSYEINDMFSVYLGARYVTAKNTYIGHLKDVNVTVGGTEMPASTYFTGAATQATSTASSLQSIIDANAAFGALTLAEAEAYTIIDAATRAALEAGYTAIGLNPTTATISDGQTGFTQSAATATAKSQLLADQSADVEQTGSAITPIIGVNISPNDKLNIGLKYEFKTELELENKTKEDFLIGFDAGGNPITMFPDGQKFNADLPALLSMGVDYKISDKFLVATGFHYYFDKSANYNKKINGLLVDNDKVIDSNFWEWALGLEYNITDKILVSAGYLMAKTGVNQNYQTDLSYSLSSNTIGFGGAYAITQSIDINLGFGYTIYSVGTKDYQHDLGGSGTMIDLTETYDKDNLFVGIGLDFKFGGKKSE